MWPQVDSWVGPRQSESPHFLPCAWNMHSACCSHSGSLFKKWSLERPMCYWNHLDWIYDWPPWRPLYKLLRFWWASEETSQYSTQYSSSCFPYPLLIRSVSYQSAMACLFLCSLLNLHVWEQIWDPAHSHILHINKTFCEHWQSFIFEFKFSFNGTCSSPPHFPASKIPFSSLFLTLLEYEVNYGYYL